MRVSFLRVAAAAAVLAVMALYIAGCGETYRPIITPNPQPGGDPQGSRRAITIAKNDAGNGAADIIDVSGDSVLLDLYVGVNPAMGTFSLGGGAAFVVNRGSQTLSVVPVYGGTNVTTVSLPLTSDPVSAGISGGYLYVADQANNVVDIVNSANVMIGTISVGTTPVAIGQSPDGTKAYVVNQGDSTVSVITTNSNVVSTTINVGAAGVTSPAAIASSSDGKWLMVSGNGSGNVAIIDTSTYAVTAAPVGTGPTQVVFDPHLLRFYVVNTGGNSLSVFDESSGTAVNFLATVSVGAAPSSVAVLNDGSRAYTANTGDGTVTVVNVQSLTVSKTIPNVATGAQVVKWIAASSDAKKVYVAVYGSNQTTDPGNTTIIATSNDTPIAQIAPPQTDLNCNPVTTACTHDRPVYVLATP